MKKIKKKYIFIIIGILIGLVISVGWVYAAGWSNVNVQTYTMGTTVFRDNAYTGCSSSSSCTTNTYTLASRTAKARMITVQEAKALGCSEATKSCPIWMYNYLYKSSSNGGTAVWYNYYFF